MTIDAVLRYTLFWDHSSYRPLERLYWRNRETGREEIDRDMAQFRLRTLFKIMHHSVVYGRRVRIQMLAFGVMPDVNREHSYIKRCKVTPDTVIPEDGPLLEPIAVRAPSAHTSGNNWYEVKLRTEFLSHSQPRSSNDDAFKFNVASRENLYVIFEDGIVPGGGTGRVVTFFNASKIIQVRKREAH